VYAKSSYGRGVGTPLTCGTKQYDAGLCYPYCKAGYAGVGPVCWETCPAARPADGGALCCDDKADCNDKIVALATGVLSAVAAAVEAGEDPTQILEAVKEAIDAILGFVMPLCTDYAR